MNTMTRIMEEPRVKHEGHRVKSNKGPEDFLSFQSFLKEATKEKQQVKPESQQVPPKDQHKARTKDDEAQNLEIDRDYVEENDDDEKIQHQPKEKMAVSLEQTCLKMNTRNYPIEDSLEVNPVPQLGGQDLNSLSLRLGKNSAQEGLTLDSSLNQKSVTQEFSSLTKPANFVFREEAMARESLQRTATPLSQVDAMEVLTNDELTLEVPSSLEDFKTVENMLPGLEPKVRVGQPKETPDKSLETGTNPPEVTDDLTDKVAASKDKEMTFSKETLISSSPRVKDLDLPKVNDQGLTGKRESKEKGVKEDKATEAIKSVQGEAKEKTRIEEKPDLEKMVMDRMYPKISTREEKELEWTKDMDPRLRDSMPPSIPTNKAIRDGEIQPKSPVALETFQKNLDMVTEQMMNRVTTLKEGADTTMTLKLFPKELGEMEISLHLREGNITGKILTDHKDLRELLLKNMDELTNTLKENKVQVTKFEVGEFTQNSFSQHKEEGSKRYFARSLNHNLLKEHHIPVDMESKSQKSQKGLNILA